jgi:SAM-dependent methyltransferase
MTRIYLYWTALKRVTAATALLTFVLAAVHFPYHVDAPLAQEQVETLRKYYTEAYRIPAAATEPTSEYQTEYIRVAKSAAEAHRIEEQVTAFVERFNLRDKPVLEIGSGRGYLQDVARDYTGLDIAATVAHFYHKKFVLGSATAMPFPDNSFDGVWSIWVFEHVPNPEQAFLEARRVTRDKGVLFLYPAWNCTSWAAEGYEVRPYSDFGLTGKLVKASIPMRSSPPFVMMGLVPTRVVRSVVARFGPTRLRYRRLTPNYEKYWVSDSDAINSIDSHEALLWFLSRGDECLNCTGSAIMMRSISVPLIIRVHKNDPDGS